MKKARSLAGDFHRKSTSYFYDIVYGTAAALVREGLLHDEQLPGRPGRPKTQATYDAQGRSRRGRSGLWEEPGGLTIYRRAADWFEVHVNVDEDEQARRRGVPDQVDLAQRATAQREIDALPRTAQEYRARCCERMQNFLDNCRMVFVMKNGGFFVSAETLAQFDEAARHVIELTARAQVTYSKDRRALCIENVASNFGVPRTSLTDSAPANRPHLTLVSSRA